MMIPTYLNDLELPQVLDRTPLVDLLGKSKPAEKLQTVRELSLKFI